MACGVRSQPWRIRHHGAVAVDGGEALLARHPHHLAQQVHAVRPFPDRVGVGEVAAQVTEPYGAEHGIGQGMAHGVGVAVAAEPPRPLYGDAAQHQGPVGIVGETVDVDALSDAHAHPLKRCSAVSRSAGVVIFRLRGSPGTTRTVAPSASTNAASSVASAPFGMGPAEQNGVEGLRRLHRHQRRAVEGGGHPLRRRPPPLSCRSPGHPGTAPPAPSVVTAAITARKRSSEASGRARVVHDDHLGGLRHGTHPAAHGLGACRPRPRRPRRRRSPWDRPPPQEGPARLRTTRPGRRPRPTRPPAARPAGRTASSAEALAGTTRHHDRPHLRHRAAVRSARRSDALRPSLRPR